MQDQKIQRLSQELSDAQAQITLNAASNSWRARLVSQLPLMATLTTVLISGYSALLTQAQYRDTQTSTRFESAVQLLSSATLTTRLGGLYLLGQIAQATTTNVDQQSSAVGLIATYLRVKFPSDAQTRAAPVVIEPAVEEVRASFAALGDRGQITNVNLNQVTARGLGLPQADFRGLVLTGSDLSGGNFQGSNFAGVSLISATLRQVNFSGANFKQANLQNADLRGSNLAQADLSGAILAGANLSGAQLAGSKNLTSAVLNGATVDTFTTLPAGVARP